MWCLVLCKWRIKALVPLWVYRRHSLPSRRCRQHDVLALTAAPGVAAARAAAVPAAAAGVVAARGGGSLQKASNRVVGGAGSCE